MCCYDNTIWPPDQWVTQQPGKVTACHVRYSFLSIDNSSMFVPHWVHCGPRQRRAWWFWHGKVCLFVCLVSRVHAPACLFAGSMESTNRGGRWGEVMEGEALISGPSSLCVPLLVGTARSPGPLPWLPDKMSGAAPHDLVLLVLWQKTTLKGNSGNHKYLGTKELYGVCCKRIYSSLGGDASVSEGLKQPVFTATHMNPPTTLGQAWRAEPNKHFSARNANTTTFPNRFQKTGVSSVSSWLKVVIPRWDDS